LKKIAENVSEKDKDTLRKIAITAMTGKGPESAKEKLADLTVRAIEMVMEKEGNNIVIDREHIKLEKKVGGSVDNSELVEGIILDKERVHSGMPRVVKNAKIALIDAALEIKDTETEAKIQAQVLAPMLGPGKAFVFLEVKAKIKTSAEEESKEGVGEAYNKAPEEVLGGGKETGKKAATSQQSARQVKKTIDQNDTLAFTMTFMRVRILHDAGIPQEKLAAVKAALAAVYAGQLKPEDIAFIPAVFEAASGEK